MIPTPLQAKIATHLKHVLLQIGATELRDKPALLADDILELIAAASPAEVIEEGGYLLGASHMWADTQGTKATEHMVRRITGPDVVVRARMQIEIDRLKDQAEGVPALREAVHSLMFRNGVTQTEDCPVCQTYHAASPAHTPDCRLAKALG